MTWKDLKTSKWLKNNSKQWKNKSTLDIWIFAPKLILHIIKNGCKQTTENVNKQLKM